MKVAGDAGAAGLIPTTDRFGAALSDIVRCSHCGHMQLAAFPSAGQLNEAYGEASSDDYIAEEPGQRLTARRLLRRLEARTAGRDILDLGCWVGFLLAEAEGRGWNGLGIEPSEFASGYARDRLGLNVLTTDLFSPDLPLDAFDAVVLADVIEHLVDPGAALERIKAFLRPGGLVTLVLPDAGSLLARLMGPKWWSVIPTHVQYFTRNSLSHIMRDHGYTVLEMGTAPKAFTVGYYLERLSGYSKLGAGLLGWLAKRLGIAHRLWSPDFRDRMFVIASVTAPGDVGLAETNIQVSARLRSGEWNACESLS